jgi:hypothetical protein
VSAGGTPLPPIGEAPPLPPADNKANAEAADFATGKLKRSDTRDKHLHYCALVFMWAALVGFLFASGVWLFHLITPNSWHFLDDSQRSSLQNVLFTAVGSAAAGNYGKKYLKSTDD